MVALASGAAARQVQPNFAMASISAENCIVVVSLSFSRLAPFPLHSGMSGPNRGKPKQMGPSDCDLTDGYATCWVSNAAHSHRRSPPPIHLSSRSPRSCRLRHATPPFANAVHRRRVGRGFICIPVAIMLSCVPRSFPPLCAFFRPSV